MHEEYMAIPAHSGIESITELRREFLKRLSRLAEGDALLLDLSGLDRFDTSLGQLLVSLKISAAKKNITLILDGAEPSRSVRVMLCSDAVSEPILAGGHRGKGRSGYDNE
jgi:ABC-type transporter Mla MlaB component